MFKTETHLHVSEVSPCAKISAYEMIKLYSEAGYHTVFVSDHLKKKFYDKLEDMPWEEKTENFLSGYEAAKKAGEEFGGNVLLSAEILLSNSPNHYLLYGIDRDFLNKRFLHIHFAHYPKSYSIPYFSFKRFKNAEASSLSSCVFPHQHSQNSKSDIIVNTLGLYTLVILKFSINSIGI